MGQTWKSKTTAKAIGCTGETLFAFRAMEEGFVVSQPMGDKSPYDFLIDNGKDILKFQVKSSRWNENEGTQKSPKYFRKGRCVFLDIQKSIIHLERVVNIYPQKIGKFHIILGEMYLSLEDFTNARYHAETASKINPDHNSPKQLLELINKQAE